MGEEDTDRRSDVPSSTLTRTLKMYLFSRIIIQDSLQSVLEVVPSSDFIITNLKQSPDLIDLRQMFWEMAGSDFLASETSKQPRRYPCRHFGCSICSLLEEELPESSGRKNKDKFYSTTPVCFAAGKNPTFEGKKCYSPDLFLGWVTDVLCNPSVWGANSVWWCIRILPAIGSRCYPQVRG